MKQKFGMVDNAGTIAEKLGEIHGLLPIILLMFHYSLLCTASQNVSHTRILS